MKDDGPSCSCLRPRDAAAALLQIPDGRYVLQLRDRRADIFFPDCWGCFGGAVEPNETPGRALLRELDEELGLTLLESQLERFTCFKHDFGFAGLGMIARFYFYLRLPGLVGLRLREGADLAAFSATEALGELRMVPYDSFALWLHHHRDRIRS